MGAVRTLRQSQIIHDLAGDVAGVGHVRRRRLLVDVSTIAQRDVRTGIQRVVRATVSALQRAQNARFEVCLVAADKDNAYRHLRPDWLHQDSRAALDLVSYEEVAVRPDDIFLALDLTASTLPRHERLLSKWRSMGVFVCTVVYDLLPITNPRWFTFKLKRNFSRWLRVVARQSDAILAISDAIATQMAQWLREDGEVDREVPIHKLQLANDIPASLPNHGLPDCAPATFEWMKRKPTVLMVGTIEPRKGYTEALAAFDWLWRRAGNSPQLLVVGRPGWKTRMVQNMLRRRSGLDGPFLWLESVSDEFLQGLYDHADGLLVTSKGEGFGLPLIEAIAHGCPVLARNLPVFRELAQPGITFFDDDRRASLGAVIAQWLAAPKAVEAAGPQSVHRSWEVTAAQIVDAVGLND